MRGYFAVPWDVLEGVSIPPAEICSFVFLSRFAACCRIPHDPEVDNQLREGVSIPPARE